jgi:hypothetical protein
MYKSPVLPSQNYFSQGQSQMQLSPMKPNFIPVSFKENQNENVSHQLNASQKVLFT